MKYGLQEASAVVATITILVGLPVATLQHGPWVMEGNHRVLHLTGVMKSGVWTDEEVNGLNYWWKSFRPATLTLQEGEEIRLRLSSSDGTHSFYIPELELGPIQVKAGHTIEVPLRAKKTGEFSYYCITVCGECHYYMRGTVKVLTDIVEMEQRNDEIHSKCKFHNSPHNFSSFVERGKYLFANKGCITCHGTEGKGGVHNPNYAKEFVPSLNDLADKMKIYWEEDADTIIKLLESNVDFLHLEEDPPIDNYSRFLAQYQSIYHKILNGSPVVQKSDPNGPTPPLSMPSWEEQLSPEDIRSILAYLISVYPWEEYE